MDEVLRSFVFAIFGYLLGSISFAMLLARYRGVDLRAVGSGNLGATNASRALGRKSGVSVYLLDAFKGFFPVWISWHCFAAPDDLLPAVCAATGAYCGHIWPIWFRFSGGKGVATLSGVLIALNPLLALISGLVFGITVFLTKFMSVGSIVFGLSLPVIAFFLDSPRPIFYFLLITGLFLCITHRSNIFRLMNGTELRVGGSNDNG